MPLFPVIAGEHPKHLAILKEALQEKMSDGQKYVVKFYANISDYSDDQFIIRAEYGMIGKLMYKLEKEFDNFRVEPPSNFTGIGMKWAEVSEDTSS